MTNLQRERIAYLRGELGWTFSLISRHIGMSHGAVQWFCLRDGIEKPGPLPDKHPAPGPLQYQRGACIVRRFTADEDARLLSMEASGSTGTEIGRSLGRRPHTISSRLAILARRDERAMARSSQAVLS